MKEGVCLVIDDVSFLFVLLVKDTYFNSKAPFTRDRIQMRSDPFGFDPLFEGRLHGIGSRTVSVYSRSDPFGFYELLGSL